VHVCPQNAKKTVSDNLDNIKNFKYTIVMPSSELYGQFLNLSDVNIVLQALLDIGFDEVFEPSVAAELISSLTLRELEDNSCERPIISSACPVVVRLISQRFPDLIPNISKYLSPAGLAAKLARERAKAETGLDDNDIGVFFVSPCPANVTEAHHPLGMKESAIDYVVSMTEIYKKLLSLMRDSKKNYDLRTPMLSVGDPCSVGGATLNFPQVTAPYRIISCDGIDSIIKLLDAVESKRLKDVDYLDLYSCVPGCVGGCMTVENPFAARSRLMRLNTDNKSESAEIIEENMALRNCQIRHTPTGALDADFKKALEKMKRERELNDRLPGLDCGSCGSPGCREFAQDVVMGYAEETDCVFNARAIMEDGGDAKSYLPPPFRKAGGNK
jgi:iron only hydrogenase large subunit-like protein